MKKKHWVSFGFLAMIMIFSVQIAVALNTIAIYNLANNTILNRTTNLNFEVNLSEPASFNVSYSTGLNGPWTVFCQDLNAVSNGTCVFDTANNISADGIYFWNMTTNLSDVNATSNQSHEIRVDSTIPTITLNFPINGAVNSTTTNITFSYTPTDTFGLRTCAFGETINNNVEDTNDITDDSITNASVNTFSQQNSEAGNYYWYVRCRDNANNTNLATGTHQRDAGAAPIVTTGGGGFSAPSVTGGIGSPLAVGSASMPATKISPNILFILLIVGIAGAIAWKLGVFKR